MLQNTTWAKFVIWFKKLAMQELHIHITQHHLLAQQNCCCNLSATPLVPQVSEQESSLLTTKTYCPSWPHGTVCRCGTIFSTDVCCVVCNQMRCGFHFARALILCTYTRLEWIEVEGSSRFQPFAFWWIIILSKQAIIWNYTHRKTSMLSSERNTGRPKIPKHEMHAWCIALMLKENLISFSSCLQTKKVSWLRPPRHYSREQPWQ